MNCEQNKSTMIIEAEMKVGEVWVDEVKVTDAKHNYTNGGDAKGVLIEVTETKDNGPTLEKIKHLYFTQTDLNTNLLELLRIISNNLEFVAVGTDPLALEIASKLSLIKTQLDLALVKVA